MALASLKSNLSSASAARLVSTLMVYATQLICYQSSKLQMISTFIVVAFDLILCILVILVFHVFLLPPILLLYVRSSVHVLIGSLGDTYIIIISCINYKKLSVIFKSNLHLYLEYAYLNFKVLILANCNHTFLYWLNSHKNIFELLD